MVRGAFIVIGTLLLLLAAIAGVVGAAMHRLTVAQKEADAAWHRPDAVATPTPEINPKEVASLASAEQDPPVPSFDSIDLWAQDATLHGQVQLSAPKEVKGRSEPHGAKAAERFRQIQAMGGRPISTYLTGFHTPDDYAEWSAELPRAATYDVTITYSCPKWLVGKHFRLSVGDKELDFTSESTRSEGSFRVFAIGKLTLPAGRATVSLRPSPDAHCLLNLRNVQLIPAPAAP